MKNVLLDLGGVVFNSTGVSNSKIDWKTISQLNKKYGHQLNLGNISVEPFLEEYNQITNQSLTKTDFLKNIFDTLSFNQKLIEFLQERFENIFILSDNYRENIEYISNRYFFKDWSQSEFYSYDFKMTKSNPQIFQLVLDKLGLTSKEVFFVDDDSGNIANAKKMGIEGICFQNNIQFFNAFNH